MNVETELRILAVLESLEKSLRDWRRELARVRRQQRELGDDDA